MVVCGVVALNDSGVRGRAEDTGGEGGSPDGAEQCDEKKRR